MADGKKEAKALKVKATRRRADEILLILDGAQTVDHEETGDEGAEALPRADFEAVCAFVRACRKALPKKRKRRRKRD